MEAKKNVENIGPKTLASLNVGEEGRVIGFNNAPLNKRRHLLDMGITRGTTIKIKTKAPLSDPVCVIVRGYELCLRKKDMLYILIGNDKADEVQK